MKKENYIAKYKRCLKEYIDTSDNYDYLQTEDNESQDDSMMNPSNNDNSGENMPMNNSNDDGMMTDDGMNNDNMGSGESEQQPMDNGQSQNAAPPEGFAPQTADSSEDSNSEDNVEEIDVDDLVNAQDDANKKISKLMNRFSSAAEKMVKMADSISTKIDATSERISKLESEMEKRNPTPVEKMTLRSSMAYPFNVSPNDYWKEKEKDSNYSTEDDKNGENDERYKITKSDVDNISDYQTISRDMARGATLKDIFDF